MKTVKWMMMCAVILLAALNANAEKKGEKTVVFQAHLHCKSCVTKIEKNIPFEKGVKDLKVDMEAQTITVTFRTDKNTEENLRKAIEKLDVKVNGTTDTSAKKEACCAGKCEKEKKK